MQKVTLLNSGCCINSQNRVYLIGPIDLNFIVTLRINY